MKNIWTGRHPDLGLMLVNHPFAVPVRRSRDRIDQTILVQTISDPAVSAQSVRFPQDPSSLQGGAGPFVRAAGLPESGSGENGGPVRFAVPRNVNRFRRRLESLVPLSGQDGDAIERITATSETFAARTDLLAQHETEGGRLILMEGFACRYRLLAEGRRQITAYLVPGDSHDLDVSVSNRMNQGMTTLTPVRVVRAEPATIAAVTRDHPAIAEGLRLAEKVEEATLCEWLVNIGARPALSRIAHLFCELELRLRAVGLAENDRCDMPITQYDLADTAGLSSVHVNRTLQELRRQGLITLTGRTLTIRDRPSLRAMAGFQPGYLRLREMD